MRVCSCYVQKCVAQLSYVQKCFSQFGICSIRPKVRQYVQKCVSSGSYIQKCVSSSSYVQKCVSSGSLHPKVSLAPRKPNPPARPNEPRQHICRLLQLHAGSQQQKQLCVPKLDADLLHGPPSNVVPWLSGAAQSMNHRRYFESADCKKAWHAAETGARCRNLWLQQCGVEHAAPTGIISCGSHWDC